MGRAVCIGQTRGGAASELVGGTIQSVKTAKVPRATSRVAITPVAETEEVSRVLCHEKTRTSGHS